MLGMNDGFSVNEFDGSVLGSVEESIVGDALGTRSDGALNDGTTLGVRLGFEVGCKDETNIGIDVAIFDGAGDIVGELVSFVPPTPLNPNMNTLGKPSLSSLQPFEFGEYPNDETSTPTPAKADLASSFV